MERLSFQCLHFYLTIAIKKSRIIAVITLLSSNQNVSAKIAFYYWIYLMIKLALFYLKKLIKISQPILVEFGLLALIHPNWLKKKFELIHLRQNLLFKQLSLTNNCCFTPNLVCFSIFWFTPPIILKTT